MFEVISKRCPLQFFFCNFSKVGVTSKSSLASSFNPFDTMMSIFKAIPGTTPKLLNLNQDHLSKKLIYLVKLL